MTYSGAKAILSRGPSRPTLYQVVLPVGGRVNDYLKFFCKATSIPAVEAEVLPIISHGSIGIQKDIVTRVRYAKPFQITVIENADFLVYKGIREWFDTIATNVNQGSGGGGPSQGQRPAYYSDIVRDFTLTKLENPGNVDPRGGGSVVKALEVTFKNAYPVRMGSISLASDAFDSATEFTVDFTYETYTAK